MHVVSKGDWQKIWKGRRIAGEFIFNFLWATVGPSGLGSGLTQAEARPMPTCLGLKLYKWGGDDAVGF